MSSDSMINQIPAANATGDDHREMKRSWMIERLQAHLVLLSDDEDVTFLEKQRDLPITQQIIATVSPESPLVIDENNGNWDWETRVAIERTLGLLEHAQEIERFLGPDGPKMAVDQLHPLIWDAAANLWNDGHYREAVGRAAAFISAHVQHRVQHTDLSDKALMNEAFRPSPTVPGRPRLLWTDATHGPTETSMREGIRSYAVGVSQAIRNPAVHGTEEMSKQVAVEQLAAMSVLVRWVDQTELDLHADDPDPNA